MTMHALHGGCHCGNLRLTLRTAAAPEQTAPRACDCGFCTRHGAAWVSDPQGRLDLFVRDRERVGGYRQGSNQARFLFCMDCGVLAATAMDAGGREFAAVNARCLDDAGRFAPAVAASPQTLAAEEKTSRWQRLWIGEVRWREATTAA